MRSAALANALLVAALATFGISWSMLPADVKWT
jgi:hypothetical protein